MTAAVETSEALAPEIEPYLRGAAEGRPVLPRCVICARLQFPPRPSCRYCGATSFDWSRVQLRGEIYSWTVTARAPTPSLAGEMPLTLVVVALDLPDPVRMVGRLADGEGRLAAGMPVVGRFEAGDGAESPVLVWRPANQPQHGETSTGGGG
jgi:uncharacterized protein